MSRLSRPAFIAELIAACLDPATLATIPLPQPLVGCAAKRGVREWCIQNSRCVLHGRSAQCLNPSPPPGVEAHAFVDDYDIAEIRCPHSRPGWKPGVRGEREVCRNPAERNVFDCGPWLLSEIHNAADGDNTEAAAARALLTDDWSEVDDRTDPKWLRDRRTRGELADETTAWRVEAQWRLACRIARRARKEGR